MCFCQGRAVLSAAARLLACGQWLNCYSSESNIPSSFFFFLSLLRRCFVFSSKKRKIGGCSHASECAIFLWLAWPKRTQLVRGYYPRRSITTKRYQNDISSSASCTIAIRYKRLCLRRDYLSSSGVHDSVVSRSSHLPFLISIFICKLYISLRPIPCSLSDTCRLLGAHLY